MPVKPLTRNPLYSREETLGQLMKQLKARLGFVTQGVASKQVDELLKSFLQEGQDYVYQQLGAPLTQKRTTITLVKGSKLYDFHNDQEDEEIDPQQVLSIDVYETDTYAVHLQQGITEQMRAADTTRETPRRYDTLNGQIELWPTPDREYPMVVIYQKGAARLERDQDRPSVPARLVFLYALASAKAHYSHADAQTAGSIFQQMLRVYKQKQHENRRYFVREQHFDDRYFVKRNADGTYSL